MKLAIIGDFNIDFSPHLATNEAIKHSIEKFEFPLEYDWISTDTIEKDFTKIISKYDGFWIAPGSPYKSMINVLTIIKYARENMIPTFGTCGGFQHMIIEFARNVLGIKNAEYDPYASRLLIKPLSCSLMGQTLEIELINKSSIVFKTMKVDKINEKYYCNFGLNPDYENLLNENGFKIVGIDISREVRILELENHPFFVATLFVPQNNSSVEKPHKLVSEFLKIIIKNESTKI